MEKALVSGELATEKECMHQMETSLGDLQQKIHRLEAQRNASRVMQETQQTKMKQKIEMKAEQVLGLEKMISENRLDKSLQDELDETVSSIEHDKKVFEDLEFQYLEDETDWLSAREELHHDVKLLTQSIEEKRFEIMELENQKVTNQNVARTDTKVLEKKLFTLLKDLECKREDLRMADNNVFQLTSQKQQQLQNGKTNGREISDSEDDVETEEKLLQQTADETSDSNFMSNSLFGSQDILKEKAQPDTQSIMSKSMNENMFFSNLETPDFSSTPKKKSGAVTGVPTRVISVDISEDITNMMAKNHDRLKQAESEDLAIHRRYDHVDDPLLRLKYNLSYEQRSAGTTDESQQRSEDGEASRSRINLNLSLEGDDFEVNPLVQRVPSQDDIDRISKVTNDAPISTQGASYKVKESIKEIERNRQLLLTQQGSHVIEHERQKMTELKKRSHDEARAQYLRLQSSQSISSRSNSEW